MLGGHGGKGLADGDHQSGSDTNSKEGITLERIELMRRQLAVNTNSSTADIESIQTLEMLGEGTFGKVWVSMCVCVCVRICPPPSPRPAPLPTPYDVSYDVSMRAECCDHL